MTKPKTSSIEYTQALQEYEIEMETPIFAEAFDYGCDLAAGCNLDIEEWRRIGYCRNDLPHDDQVICTLPLRSSR